GFRLLTDPTFDAPGEYKLPHMGAVGVNWQFSGIGNFSSRGTSDMILRNSNTGGLQGYDINSNQITRSALIGTVGLHWQFSGAATFSSGSGESDLLLRNSKTGGLEVLNINNNQVTGSGSIGTVGLEWLSFPKIPSGLGVASSGRIVA